MTRLKPNLILAFHIAAIILASCAEPETAHVSTLLPASSLTDRSHLGSVGEVVEVFWPAPDRSTAILLVDPVDGSERGRLATIGDGACAFLSLGPISHTAKTASKTSLDVYLPRTRSIVRLQRDWLADPNGLAACQADARPVRLQSEWPILGVGYLSPDTLVAVGLFSEGRLAFFDSSGTLLGQRGPLPPNPDSVSADIIQHAYQPALAVSPNGRHIAVASRFASLLELFDGQGTARIVAQTPIPVAPIYSVAVTDDGSKVFASGDSLRFGYVAVAATDSLVYALFSGRSRGDVAGPAYVSSDVHVFDWDGKLVERLSLPVPVFELGVEPTSGALIGIADPTARALVRIDLHH